MASSTRKPAVGYIGGPIVDWVFLIGAPLVAILVYLPFHFIPRLRYPMPDDVGPFTSRSIAEVFINIVIFSHLFIVFFRSHLNPKIFFLHPLRFTLIPIALFVSMFYSAWILAAIAVLAVWWDVYHSSLQTFGIGRIYDMRRGNDPLAGRLLDICLNLLLYTGPIFGGVSLMFHLMVSQDELRRIPQVEAAFADWTVLLTGQYAPYMSYALLSIGIPFCVYYVYRYWRLWQQGYQVSFQKVALLVILALVSMGCWGFNSFGEAFFVMNFFHAWQYFFIVWFMEKQNITSSFRLSRFAYGRQVALALFVLIGVGYGVWAKMEWVDWGATSWQELQRVKISLLLVISIMHFWYDGFIWSVRKGQVG